LTPDRFLRGAHSKLLRARLFPGDIGLSWEWTPYVGKSFPGGRVAGVFCVLPIITAILFFVSVEEEERRGGGSRGESRE